MKLNLIDFYQSLYILTCNIYQEVVCLCICVSAVLCDFLSCGLRVPGDEHMLWQSLGLLEEGLSHSPSNAQFKLLLVLLYCRLGAFEPVVDLYSSLDAKHIQHDTIG